MRFVYGMCGAIFGIILCSGLNSSIDITTKAIFIALCVAGAMAGGD